MKHRDGISAGLAFLAAAVAVGLLWNSAAVAEGMRQGLHSCADLLIPALFPFMILAGLIGATKAGARLSHAVAKILRPVTGLPPELGAAQFMGLIGGFPVGARMLSDLLERKEISRDTAGRALCCCVNAGPSFLITAVGAGLFGSRGAGTVLLAAQTLSALCISALIFRRRTSAKEDRQTASVPPSNRKGSPADAFVEAVRGAAASMFGVCAFVLAFSALTALLRATGLLDFLAGALGRCLPMAGTPFFAAALSGLLEVTNGCINASVLSPRAGYLLSAFLVSFSSCSIVFQVRSCFPAKSGVAFGRFYLSRPLHGALTLLFSLPGMFLLSPDTRTASVVIGNAVPRFQSGSPALTVCLIGMCSILLLRARTIRK